jgi:mannose-1-phosphate guanylyltransferase
VLVGARADRAATDLGWILRGQKLDESGILSAVEHFVEKPGSAAATRLLEAGALFNTLLIAMDGAAFWDKALSTRPELAHSFQRLRSAVATSNEAAVRHEVYERLPTLDLSRDLLANERGLAVVEMADAGWSDCGTPERLFECLEVNGDLGGLLRRLGATGLEISP